MMNYPENYAVLDQDEMEYVGGGFKISIDGNVVARLLLSMGTTYLGYLNIGNIAGVSAQLEKTFPERYKVSEGMISRQLLIDSTMVYFTSPIGILLGLANVAAGLGTVCFTLKTGL